MKKEIIVGLLIVVALIISSCGTLTYTGNFCEDGIKDRDETDVDCGGQYCRPCLNGMGCDLNEDCESGICDANRCASGSTESGCYHDWSCTDWSECQSDGTQTRTCTYTGTCSTTGDPEETEQTCTYVSSTESFTLCNDDLYLGTSIADCQNVLTDADLDLLADDVYHDAEGTNINDEKYSQLITFGTSTGIFEFVQDDEDAPTADNYLFVDNNNYFYSYSFSFDDAILYDATSLTTIYEDFIGTTITLMGKNYVITGVSGDGIITSLSLMTGNFFWMVKGESITQTIDGIEYTIELTDVASDDNSCTFNVDGSEVVVNKYYVNSANGLTLGVNHAKRVNIEAGDQDVCEVTIGAVLLILNDGYGLQINGLTVSDSLVTIDSYEGELSGFTISYAPSPGELYLSTGDSLEDPLFDAFNIEFESIENDDYETIEFVAGSTSAEIRFKNKDGQLVEIPLAADSASASGEASTEPVYWGNEAPTSTTQNQDELVYFEGETCTGSTSVVDCQGAMFLVVDAYGQAHLIQITNIDTTSNLIDFDDLTYGEADEGKAYTEGSLSTIALTYAGDVGLTIDETAKTITFTNTGSSDDAVITTENKASLKIINKDITSQTFEGMKFSEYNDDETEKGYLSNFEITGLYDDATDNSIEWSGPLSLTSAEGYVLISDTVDDFQHFETWKGTLVEYDGEILILNHPYHTIYAVVTLNSLS